MPREKMTYEAGTRTAICRSADVMWGTGTGSEVMRRIAAPMVGGMVSATILTLIVIPAIYALVKEWELRRHTAKAAREPAAAGVPPQVAPM